MTIQLPNYLLVAANLRVQVIDAGPMREGRALAGDRFQAPVDRNRRAERLAEVETLEAKQIKLAGDDAVGCCHDLRFRSRPPAAHLCNQTLGLIEACEKRWISSRAKMLERIE